MKSCLYLGGEYSSSREPMKATSDDADRPNSQASPAGREKRRDYRIPVTKTARMRQPGSAEEVIHLENVSRGGLCFRSSRKLPVGTMIEIAVLFSSEAANIFVPARIVWTQELPEERLVRYGVAYIRSDAPQG